MHPPSALRQRETTARAAPFLKWAGGKGTLADAIIARFPRAGYRRYYEPFLGGGAVFFKASPKGAVLSDTNPELINAFIQVRDNPSKLIDLLERHQECHSRAHYYSTRAANPSDAVERAARMIYLNRTCFNGLWRVNSQGKFNVPMGSYKEPRIVDPGRIMSAAAALQGTAVICAPFDQVLLRHRLRPTEGDLVYLDPPYHPLSATSKFTAYTANNFGEEDQKALAKIASILTERNVKVILSNSATPFVRSLYTNALFHRSTVKMSRSINSVGSGRGKIDELLIINFSS